MGRQQAFHTTTSIGIEIVNLPNDHAHIHLALPYSFNNLQLVDWLQVNAYVGAAMYIRL